MSSDNENTILNQLLVENKRIFFPDYTKNDQCDIETPFDMNISSQSSGFSGEENEIINVKNNADSSTFIPSTLYPNPMPTLDEIIQINSKDSDDKKISFISSEKSNLFSYTEKNFD